MQFTCNSCNIAFESAEDQRSHMKSDWHRYNLKRRVAQLPPINEDLFSSKVSALSISADGEDTEKAVSSSKKQITKKEQRRREKEALQDKKRQILEMARQAMAKENKDSEGEDKDVETVDYPSKQAEITSSVEEVHNEVEQPNEEEESNIEETLMAEKLSNKVEIPITTCLFCHSKHKVNFKTVDENTQHMFEKHGLYIPEPKYLVDKDGLIRYLGEKIGLGNVCLCCNYQGRDIEAVREHMLNKRHMRLPYESEDEKLEISEFYDFTSTYDETPAGDSAAADDEGWEDVSDVDDDDSDNEVDNAKDAIYRDGYDLILPSGATVGHRALARYYRQNLPAERVLTEGQGTVIAAETRHMLTLQDRKVLAEQKRSWSRQKKREDVNDRRAAKFINNQPHYRDQLLQ